MNEEEKIEKRTAIIATALNIATAAPTRFSRAGYYAYIRRDLIVQLRRELEAYGLDWKALKASRLQQSRK
jgi:hypothetical protein